MSAPSDFAHRGSKMTISTAFRSRWRVFLRWLRPVRRRLPDRRHCRQERCQQGLENCHDKDIKVSVQIAPAVRVALGQEFGLAGGENSMGKIVAALRRMGFDKTDDTFLRPSPDRFGRGQRIAGPHRGRRA